MLTRSHKRSIFTGLVLLVAVFYVLVQRPQLKEFQGKTMGTTYSISYGSNYFEHSAPDLKVEINQLLEQINDSMSTYRPDSELMQFNGYPVGKPFRASPELLEVIELSLDISRLSGGAYDVTVGPLVNVWGFGPRTIKGKPGQKAGNEMQDIKAPEFIKWMLANYPAELPEQSNVDAARARVGYKSLVVNKEEGTLTRGKDLYVDLSSIAKGYGVDRVAALLESKGITNYMVEIGGEVKLSGFKPDGSQWLLLIRGSAIAGDELPALISLTDKAVATSGDYLNFYEVDGQKYSHTIDPRIGHPEMGRLAEVAVIADTVAKADAMATMFMVLGDKEGLKLANREDIAAYFTYHSDGSFESVSSDAFKPYLETIH
ncbi:FAD:protein FMN transferase [Endozoicomonas sp. OPT23]|uniref:FAD:protein FMN transferase n=1 Tax=Endozoicomonas sp. OPT23 TaxID=2072845 RepID=UPI001891ADFD|nr:FAD:protein FMN transferase [Endozoicomonas sp. OPT23]